VPILLDGTVREQIEAVEDELDRLDDEPEPADNDLRLGSKPKPNTRRKELDADLAQLRATAEESTLYVVLEGMQRTAFRALLAQHPPRKDADGKMNPHDRLIGANMDTIAAPLVRACTVGYRERPEADAPVLDFPPDGTPDQVTAGWLFGRNVLDLTTGEVLEEVPPFCTEKQIDMAAGVAIALCVGDDAVPLPRRRSAPQMSDAG
jgi:hypothetical protein